MDTASGTIEKWSDGSRNAHGSPLQLSPRPNVDLPSLVLPELAYVFVQTGGLEDGGESVDSR